MKRQIRYLLIALAALGIFSIWYVPRHTWRVVSLDGYSDTDRGMSVMITIWKSGNDDSIVVESVSIHSSSEDAQKVFREELKGLGGTSTDDMQSGDSWRGVKRLGNAEAGEKAVIIKVKGKEIHCIESESMKSASAFEKSWLKLNY